MHVGSIVSKLIFNQKIQQDVKWWKVPFRLNFFLLVSVLLKLLNLVFLCICFVADVHSCGWSSSPTETFIRYLRSALPGLQEVASLCFDVLFFFFSWLGQVEDFPAHTELIGSLFFQSFTPFTIHTVRPSPKLMHVVALCVLNHSLQPLDVTTYFRSIALFELWCISTENEMIDRWM